MSKNLTAALGTLATLTDSELRILNSEICERLKAANRMKQLVAAAAFRVGDQVSFTARDRGTIRGEIIKIMPKNIRVKVGNVQWTVSPSLLKKAA